MTHEYSSLDTAASLNLEGPSDWSERFGGRSDTWL